MQKQKVVLSLILFLSLFKLSAQPFALQWERTLMGDKENSNFRVNASAVDANNCFYFTGAKDTSVTSKSFLNKYNPDGSISFQTEYYPNSLGWSAAYAVTVDLNGNSFIAGFENIDDSLHLFIVKFNPQGNLLWTYKEPTYMDVNNPKRFEIILTTDSTGSLYYAYHNAALQGSQLKCGKLNLNGSIAWQNFLAQYYDGLVAFKMRSDNNLEVGISSSNRDSVSITLYDTSFNALSIYKTFCVRGITSYIDAWNNTYCVIELFQSIGTIPIHNIYINSILVLNEIWQLPISPASNVTWINGNGGHLNLLNDAGIYSIDSGGTVNWYNYIGNYLGSFDASVNGDAYVGYSVGGSHDFACFQVYDSSGTLKQLKCFLDFIYPVGALNGNSSYMSGMLQACCDHYGNQVVYYDSSFTDSVFYTNTNYQHKMDRELKSLTDHDHNIIDMCSAVDTIIYSGYYAYPSLQVSKFDSSGILRWKKKINFTSNSYFNYTNSFIDANNNVYACGNSQGIVSNTQGCVVKISADGLYTYRYLYYDSVPGGRYSINAVTADSFGNIYAGGVADTSNYPNYASDGVIIKFDSMLNCQWIRHITIRPTAAEQVDNLELRNNVLILSVHSVLSGVGQTFVCEFDTSGNPILTHQVSVPYVAYSTIMKINSIGNITLAGITIPANWYVVSLDSAGNYLCDWRDTLSPADWNNRVLNLVVDDYNNIFVIGDIFNGQTGNYCVRKFQNCNVEWTDSIIGFSGSGLSVLNNRVYASASATNTDMAPVTIYDSSGVILFRDSIPGFQYLPSSIIAESNSFYTTSNLRTDTVGVIVSVRRYNNLMTNVAQDKKNNIGLDVYPNPSSTYLIVSSAEKKLKEIKLYNVSGQMIFSKNLTPDNYYRLDLPGTFSGQFFYIITDVDQNRYSGKVTIIR
ncbi:MAG: T9SS type A sorting domain-containing protein [Bacteroidetes bacterium]|nr:T9SS type A sorting domain-containing protein [Bacteroidota bacterium]